MPNADELDLVTVVFHTTALRATRWEVQIPKPFLKEGAFNVQQIHTSPTPRLERKLGELTRQEFDLILDKIAERLSL
jgi:mRNA interferase MazF